MSNRKYAAFTLWRKWRDLGWRPHFTVESSAGTRHIGDISPREVIEDWMASRFHHSPNSYWERGKTWIIKPEGQKPAGLKR